MLLLAIVVGVIAFVGGSFWANCIEDAKKFEKSEEDREFYDDGEEEHMR